MNLTIPERYMNSFMAMSEKSRSEITDAAIRFCLWGEIVEHLESEGAAVLWPLLLEELLQQNNNYHNGCKGGRPKKNPQETPLKPLGNPPETPNTTYCSSCSIPTLSEIVDYADSISIKTDIQAFYDYNQMRHWKVSDWRAALRRWASLDGRKNGGGRCKTVTEQQYTQRDKPEDTSMPEWQVKAMEAWLDEQKGA